MQFSRRQAVAVASGAAILGGIGLALPAMAQTPASGDATTATRTITHAGGTSEIPVAPQRVIALDGPVLDAAILLGVTPAGATTGVANDPFPAYLGASTEGIANVGTIVEPNLELIATLNPDLIIGVKTRHEAIYDQLSGIAPTVLVESHIADFRENFAVFADALGHADAVAAISDEYDTKTAALATDLGDQLDTTAVSILRIYTTTLYAYQGGAFSGQVLSAVGIQRPEMQADPEALAAELSPEQLGEADGDVIFLAVWGDDTNTDVSTVTDNPLWPSLSAVQANRVYLVPDETWMVASGYLAAGLVLDDIRAYLIDGKESPVPTAD